MALMGCVGSRAQEALLHTIEEAVKENAVTRLAALLGNNGTPICAEQINHKHLLHRAAWLGYPRCVKLLIEQGADPDQCHRKNGCTPLHLAHFCTIEDTNPEGTVKALISAGARVNNPGSHKCGKYPIDHAIQHQRLDSVQVLLSVGSLVTLQSVLVCIDVANPQILETLLLSGAQCGRMLLDATLFWGQPLHRVLYTPLKCPKECYKQMFHMLTQATVCAPMPVVTPTPAVTDAGAEAEADTTTQHDAAPRTKKLSSSLNVMVETELRQMAKDYVDLAQYLYAFLLRSGFYPPEVIKTYMNALGEIEWVESYLANPPPLKELTIRVIRSHLFLSGNIMYGVNRLDIPKKLKEYILMPNPL